MRHQQILLFLQLLLEKVNKKLNKPIADTKARLKKFCMQKGIGFINNNNIKKDFLGKKRVTLGQRRNSVSAKNLLK